MNQITGKLIFNESGYTVHTCADGFTVSDGNEIKVVPSMPCLNANNLVSLFAKKIKSQCRSIAAHKNNISNPLKKWVLREAEQQEMYLLGY